MIPEVIVVGERAGGEPLVQRVRGHGYEAAVCLPAAIEGRLEGGRLPGAIVVCFEGLDIADVMKRLRATRLGASVPVTLYGELDEQVRDLADVLDLGADHFLTAPASDQELVTALEELAGPAAAAPTPVEGPEGIGGSYGSWPNRTAVIEVSDDALPSPDEVAAAIDVSLAEPTPTPPPAPTPPPEPANAAADGSSPGQAPGEAQEENPSEVTGTAGVGEPRAERVIGQLHRTLDMLEERLRDGDVPRATATDATEESLDDLGLDALPHVDGSATPDEGSPRLVVEEFELPVAAIIGRRDRRRSESSLGPESTVRLEETGTVGPPPGTQAQPAPASPVRREPLEPELESQADVRDRPRRKRPMTVDREGSLEAVEVPRLLWRLHRALFSGRLTLLRGRIEKSVWWADGEPVFARSNVGFDRLSDGMLRRGLLTRSQYETARSLAAKEPRRAGQILVEAGFVKPGELHRVLRLHLQRIIDSTLPWTSGSWQLVEGEACDEPVLLDEPTARVVADGVRNRFEPAQLSARLGGNDAVPRLVGPAASEAGRRDLAEAMNLTASEESWLRGLTGARTLAELRPEAGADELELLALVYALHVMEHVDLTRERQPEPARAVDPAGVDAIRVRERLVIARQADYFEILGLPRDACRVDVTRAHAEVASTFDDENLEPRTRTEMGIELAELRAALAEARDVLMDDGLRGAYLAHLEEP